MKMKIHAYRRWRQDSIRWAAHNLAVQRSPVSVPLSLSRCAPTGDRVRGLILSIRGAIGRSQIYPYFYYRDHLRERYAVDLWELDVDRFLARTSGAGERADLVILQPWFRLGDAGLSRLLEEVRERCRPSRIAFLDSYAPTDLRFARTLADSVDVYVKKHVLRDRSQYGKPTRGESNLTDFFAPRYGIDLPEEHFEVPEQLLDRLVVGPSFATADYMFNEFRSGRMLQASARYDVHARLGRKGSDWYEALRREALDVLGGIDGVTALTEFGVSKPQYLAELSESRLCFSPFGYGEVAWRDYEAVMCGSLLVKQDMSHVETHPNVFVEGKTYISVRWDFADLEEKVRYFLAHEKERQHMAEEAFAVLRDYAQNDVFLEQMAPIFSD